MIKTIFYFVNSLEDYIASRDNTDGKGGISPETITFVEETREIYRDGRKYSGISAEEMMSSEEFQEWKDLLDQRLEEDKQDVDDLVDSAILDINDTIGGVSRSVDGISVLLSETERVLDEKITLAKADIQNVSGDLDDFQSQVGEDIQTAIDDAMTNGSGKTVWQEIDAAKDIAWEADRTLNSWKDNEGNIKYEVVSNAIGQGIDADADITKIKNSWAVSDEGGEVIEWMSSGYEEAARAAKEHEPGSYESFQKMYTAALNETNSAISRTETSVKQYADDKYLAKSNVESLVKGIVNEEYVTSMSSIVTENDLGGSKTTFYNDYLTTKSNGQANSNAIANVQLETAKDRAAIEAITVLEDPEHATQSSSYIMNKSTLDVALTNMIVEHTSEESEYTAVELIQGIATDEASSVLLAAYKKDPETGEPITLAQLTETVEYDSSKIQLMSALIGEDRQAIASLQTEASSQGSKLSALATFQQGQTPTLKSNVITASGLVASSDLDSAVAGLIARQGGDGELTEAAIIASVHDNLSQINLTADNIRILGDTLADTIYAEKGTIGGINIAQNSLSSSNGNFSLTSDGTLTAVNAVLSGNITATSGKIAQWNITTNEDNTSSLISTSWILRGGLMRPTSEMLITSGYEQIQPKISMWDENSNSTLNISPSGIVFSEEDSLNPGQYTVKNKILSNGTGRLGDLSWNSNGKITVSHDDTSSVVLDNGVIKVWDEDSGEYTIGITATGSMLVDTGIYARGEVHATDFVASGTVKATEFLDENDFTMCNEPRVRSIVDEIVNDDKLYTEEQVRSMIIEAINFVLDATHTTNGTTPQLAYYSTASGMHNLGWNMTFKSTGISLPT